MVSTARSDLRGAARRKAGDRPGARALAGEALAIYQRAGRRDGVAEIAKWLAQHR